LAERHALGGQPVHEGVSSFNAHLHTRKMRFMERLLRLSFRVLGPERYGLLMKYLGYVSSMRNQRGVFFSD
jgi:hypothetical protein